MPTISPHPEPYYSDPASGITVHHGDCLEVLRRLPAASVDSVCCDPPYGLEFMGKEWDAPWKTAGAVVVDPASVGGFQDGAGGNPFSRSRIRYGREGDASVGFQAWCELWATECLRVLKPGGHMLAFGGTRTFHRLACAVEDAGFEIRDSIAWMYGSGFPKSLDVSKAIDKALSAERVVTREAVRDLTPGDVISFDQRSSTERERRDEAATPAAAAAAAAAAAGWGTALKPAFEPIVVGRKPLVGTVAANYMAHGTGALNIAGCRVGDEPRVNEPMGAPENSYGGYAATATATATAGRWPANVVLDEYSAGVLDEQAPNTGGAGKASGPSLRDATDATDAYGARLGFEGDPAFYGDTGGASRFFYVAKADQSERVKLNGTAHPTVKPIALMRWLIRLVTPPGGTVLEPFAGSGTTVEACLLEGFQCIAIEREADYLPLIVQRINRRRDPVAAVKTTGDDGGLFDLLDGGAA